jgi:ABC-type methionine transport system permease subunit
MVLTILGEGVLNLIIVLGIGQWVTYARIARAETLVQREREFVEAARALGATEWRIMFRTILPNILTPLIVIASFNVAGVILAEASLIPRSRRAGERADLGRDAGGQPQSVAQRLVVAGGLPRPGDHVHRRVT